MSHTLSHLHDKVREEAKWLQTALDGGQPSANLHGAPHRLMRAKRTRRWHISESTSPGVCNGDVKLALPLANARRAHAIAHVLPLPCGEVLRIADHEKMASKQASLSAHVVELACLSAQLLNSRDCAPPRFVPRTREVATGCERRCLASLVHGSPAGVPTATHYECAIPRRRIASIFRNTHQL
jgi:hypothetical protein